MRLPVACLLLSLPLMAACGSTQDSVRPPAAPVQVQDLTVVDRNGERHDIGARLAEGKPVALIFWQTWCASCLKEAPQLAADAKQWGNDVLFLGVIPGPEGTVDEEALDAVVAKYALPYAQVRDKDMALTKRFEVDGTPTILVLGKDGKVNYRGHQPPTDWSALVK